jgi:hypothetical protein
MISRSFSQTVEKQPPQAERTGRIVITGYSSGREGSGFGRERWKHIDGWKIGSFIRSSVVCTCPNPIAAGLIRPYGRMVKTMVPALLDFLNPEP